MNRKYGTISFSWEEMLRVGLLFLLITLFFFPFWYVLPTGDDFVYAHLAEKQQTFFVYEYTYTNARVVATALLHIMGVLVPCEALYRITLLFFALMFVLALRAYVVQILIVDKGVFLSTIVLFLGLTSYVPSIYELFFQYTAVVNYLVGLLWLVWGIVYWKKQRVFFRVLGNVFFILSMLTHELFVLMTPLFVWFHRKDIEISSLLIILLLVIGGMHYGIAPATEHRAELFVHHRMFFHVVMQSLLHGIRFSILFFAIPMMVLLSYMFLRKNTFLSLLKYWCYAWVFLAISILLPVASMGLLGQYRTVNVGFILAGLLIVRNFRDEWLRLVQSKKLMLLIVLTFFASPSIKKVGEDVYFGNFQTYVKNCRCFSKNLLDCYYQNISCKKPITFSSTRYR